LRAENLFCLAIGWIKHDCRQRLWQKTDRISSQALVQYEPGWGGALSFQKVSGSIARRRQRKKLSLALSDDRGKSGILIRN
jgi:hypothetical protein